MGTIYSVQQLRNGTIFENKDAAVLGLKSKATYDGMITLSRYYADDSRTVVKTLIGINYNPLGIENPINNETASYTIYDADIDAFSELSNAVATINGDSGTSGSFLNAIQAAVSDIKGDVSDNGNTLGKLEDMIENTLNDFSAQFSKLSADSVADESKFVYDVTQVDGKISVVTKNAAEIKLGGYVKDTEKSGDIESSDTLGDALNKIANKIDNTSAVGVIESSDKSIVVNGASANVDIKLNLKTDDSVLGKDENGALMTTIAFSSVTPSSDSVKEEYQLVGKDGVKLGDTIKIYKDSALLSVALLHASGTTIPEYDGTWHDIDDDSEANLALCYAYSDVNGETQVVAVPVGSFLRESEFKDGLQVVGGEVSVKVDGSGDDFLSVSENGVKLSGVQNAIDTAKNDAVTSANNTTTEAINGITANTTSTGGNAVTVTIAQTAGKITAVTVNDSDVATTSDIDTAKTELQGKIDAVSGAATSVDMTGGTANIADNQLTIDTDASQILMDGYTKATASTEIAASDSISEAIGKLEYKADDVYTKQEIDDKFDAIGTGGTGASYAYITVNFSGGTAKVDNNPTGSTINLSTDATQIHMGSTAESDTVADVIAKLQTTVDSNTTEIEKKANSDDVYDKTAIDEKLDAKLGSISVNMTGGTATADTSSTAATISIDTDASQIKMDGYTKATASTEIAASDNISEAIGKLEYKADDVYTKDDIDKMFKAIGSGTTGTSYTQVEVNFSGGTAKVDNNNAISTINLSTDASQITMKGYAPSTGGSVQEDDTIAEAIAKVEHNVNSINTDGITIYSTEGGVGTLVQGYEYYMESPNSTIKISADESYNGVDGEKPKLNLEVNEEQFKTINGANIIGAGNIDARGDIDLLNGFGGASIWNSGDSKTCVTDGSAFVLKLTNSKGETREVALNNPTYLSNLTLTSQDMSMRVSTKASRPNVYCKDEANQFDVVYGDYVIALPNATEEAAGLMSKEDKQKINNVYTKDEIDRFISGGTSGDTGTSLGKIDIYMTGGTASATTNMGGSTIKINTDASQLYMTNYVPLDYGVVDDNQTINEAIKSIEQMGMDSRDKLTKYQSMLSDFYGSQFDENMPIKTIGVDFYGQDYVQFVSGKNNYAQMRSETTPFRLSAATTDQAGVMSASDKKLVDHFSTFRSNYLALNSSRGDLTYGTDNVKLGSVHSGSLDDLETNEVLLTGASVDSAGIMTASDKQNLDELTKYQSMLSDFYGEGNDINMPVREMSVASLSDKLTLSYGKNDYSTGAGVAKSITISAATTSHAGVMSKDDKAKLDSLTGLTEQQQTMLNSIAEPSSAGIICALLARQNADSVDVTASLQNYNSKSCDKSSIGFTIQSASSDQAGVMSKDDKIKLDSLTGLTEQDRQNIEKASYLPNEVISTPINVNANVDKVDMEFTTREVIGGDSDVVYASIPAATTSQAGVMSKDDKAKLDSLTGLTEQQQTMLNSIAEPSSAGIICALLASQNADSVNVTASLQNYNSKSCDKSSIGFTIQSASSSQAGVMSASDKKLVDHFSTFRSNYLALNSSRGDLTYGTDNVKLGSVHSGSLDDLETNEVLLTGASVDSAGIMTASDKQNLDELTKYQTMLSDFYGEGNDINMPVREMSVASLSDKLTLSYGKNDYSTGAGVAKSITISAATTSHAGVMSKDDKAKLDGLKNNLVDIDFLKDFNGPSIWNDQQTDTCISTKGAPLVMKMTNNQGEVRQVAIPGAQSSLFIYSEDGSMAAAGTFTPSYCKKQATEFDPMITSTITIPSATSSQTGLMSKSDKAKLDGTITGLTISTKPVSVTDTEGASFLYTIDKTSGGTVSGFTIPIASTSRAGLISSSEKTKLNSLSESIVIDCSSYTKIYDVIVSGLGGKRQDIVENRYGNLFFTDRNGSIGAFTYFYNSESDEIQGTGQIMATTSRFTDLGSESNYQFPVSLYYRFSDGSIGLYQNGGALFEQ